MPTTVAVCQVPDIRGDMETSLIWIEKMAADAAQKGAALVAFPECFLQGYFTEKLPALKYAINLQSEAFTDILNRLANYHPTIVFGLIEEANGLLFNTAVVIKEGVLMGKYRKTHLLKGETAFTAGTDYPIFKINDLPFGINICYDTQFAEATANLTDQGAKMICCISNTMMRYENAIKYKYLHFSMRAERAKEKEVWLLSTDITGEMPGRIAYGSTSIINPSGVLVKQLPFMETGLITITL